MIQLEISLADLIRAVQDASETEAQVMAALIHLLLGDESEIGLGA